MAEEAYEAVARQADGLLAGEAFAETSEPAAYVPPPVPQEKLETYKKMFAHAREHTIDARRRSMVDIDYRHNRQWTSAEIEVLRRRKQPQIWINRIAPAVNGILGVLEQGQSDPRALPRTNDDMNAAEIATDSLRYGAEKARWQRTKLSAAEDFLVPGIGAVIIEVNDELDPFPRHIAWEEFFYDPHSRKADFTDARYMGIAKWMYADQIEAAFQIRLTSDDAKALPSLDETDEDKPTSAAGTSKTAWGDPKALRFLVVEMYHNDGGWKRCIFYGGAVLAFGDSPYLDEKGQPVNPIEAQACYVDRDNQRYGVVRAMVPIQDEINMRRSKLLHMVNSRQVRQTMIDAEGDANTARREAARPDGALPFGWEPVAQNDMAAGQASLLSESKSEIERMGPNPAVLGRQGESASGRSKLVQQQAGLTELTPALGGMEDLELRVYRQMWARIRQFWKDPKWIRVTDDIGAPKFLQVNEPVVTGHQMVMDPTGRPVLEPIIEQKNRPAEMDMDIIIDATPDSANLQQEQFAELVKLAGIYGPEEVPFEDLLEASSLPKKRQLLEKRDSRRKEAMQQGPPPPNPMQEAAFRAEMDNKAADAEAKRAKAYRDTVAAESQGINTLLETGPPPPMPVQPPPFVG